MAAAKIPDEEFLRLFNTLGASGTARETGVSVRKVYQRRKNLEAKIDSPIQNPNNPVNFGGKYAVRLPLEVKSGIVLIGSDAHYRQGVRSTAHRAFCHLAEEFASELKIACLNGDVADFPGISRHAPLGWESRPSMKEELEVCLERTDEIEESARRAKLLWNIGNHDQRFDSRLSNQAHEFRNVSGFTLQDHFPKWQMAISSWINNDVVIKHRFKGGIHATHNNTLCAGKSIVTGHLHSLKVTPLADYNGNRFGVDTGTMAEIYDEAFLYNEDNAVNWRSGLVVLTFHRGKLLWPEIVHVLDEKHFEFRGQIISV